MQTGDNYISRSANRLTGPCGYLSREGYRRNVHLLLLAYCFAAALSIALSQILLGAAVLYSGVFFLRSAPEERAKTFASPITAPLAYWVLAGAIATVCGVDPRHSVFEWAKSTLYLLLPFMLLQSFDWDSASVRETVLHRIRAYLFAFAAGQTAAALHTLAEAGLQTALRPRPPGAVTESGQLALLIPCLIALYRAVSPGRDLHRENWALVLLFALLLIMAWPEVLQVTDAAGTARFMLGMLIIALSAMLFRYGAAGGEDLPALRLKLLVSLCACLMFAAFLINLKRGPWTGVVVAFVLLGAVSSRRLIVKTFIVSSLVLLTLYPARHRLFSFAEDFTISGGRQVMWSLGVELAERFPLGLGPGNASYMRRLDETLPALHRHMHNNLLNVAAETGWIGLAAFVWWMFASIAVGFRVARAEGANRPAGTYAICISAALIAWQVAGLVEYNFGDGEVRLIAFFLIGLLLVLHRAFGSASPRPLTNSGGSKPRDPLQQLNILT